MSNSPRLILPKHAPKIAPLSEVRGAEFLPFAVYKLAGIPNNEYDELVATINKDHIIGKEPNETYLARCALEHMSNFQTLDDIVAAHIDYCKAHLNELNHFPFGFLVAHDRDWNFEGLLLVYIDFEEPFEVTGFRVSIEDVAPAAETLRNDDNGAQVLRDIYEMTVMSYVPLGWTPERLAAATADELLQLDYSTLHLVSPMAVSSPSAQDAIFGARIDELTRRERERFKLSPVLPRFRPDTPLPEDDTERTVMQQRMRKWLDDERVRYLANPDVPAVPLINTQKVPKPDVDAVVQVVQEAGYDDFGYVLVRLDYTDEDAWTRWNTIFHQYLDRSLEESLGGESIADKLLIVNVEDEDLDGTGWHGAVSYYEDVCANDTVPPGLETGMILVADTEAVSSLLQPTSDVEPWIWAADVDYDWEIGDQPSLGSSPARHYPGYIRVALSVVLSEFWPLLKRPGCVGRHLWTPDLGVWEGIGV
ncbi:hypothetical protein KCU95_g12806, partial [Aureobasidium melanogenum]